MAQYQVIVGNVGAVWTGKNGFHAIREFYQWRKQSQNEPGRAHGEPVTLTREGEPVRDHGGHSWFLYRQGDGNEGNFPRYYVRIPADVCPFRYLAACVANRYIVGSKTRRYVVANIETGGEAEYGVLATVYEGPKGETAFDSAWLTAEFEPADFSDVRRNGLQVFENPRDHLDRAALRMLKKRGV
jgi:hypothetical protein